MKHLRWMWVTLCVLALVPGTAWSQAVNATLLGTITDTTGASVPNARISITEVNTGATREGQTNESGNYVFTTLPPGTYTVTVEASGFKKEIRRNIDVIVNTNTRVDAQLTPGAVSETIDVTAAPPLLQTDRADTGAKIETATIANLPLGTQRNFQALLNLVPGTTRATFQHSQFFNASSSLQTEVNGQMRQGNNYQIEGIDDNERTGLLQILIPPLEAIQTVDVSTSNHDAELGRSSGAVTNVILKSGSNDLHGAAYYFARNSSLNARNFFDPSVGHLAYNYYGGNVGGYIRKNKLFYFADILRITDHEANTNLGTIPPSAWRTGDLSASATQIYDPATGNIDGSGRVPFAGNVIPASRINPVSTKIMGTGGAAEPVHQRGARPATTTLRCCPTPRTPRRLDGKIDYNVSDKDRLSGRFSFARPVIYQAPIFGTSGGWANSAFQGTGVQKTYSTGVNYDHNLLTLTGGGGPRGEWRTITTWPATATTARRLRKRSAFPASTWTPGPAAPWASRSTTASRIRWWATSTACRGCAPKPTSTWSIPGPRRCATTPSSGASITAACAMTCCRRRPSARAACTTSAPTRPPSRVRKRASPTTWPVSCWTCRTSWAATCPYSSRRCARTSSSLSARTNGRCRPSSPSTSVLRWEFYPPATPRLPGGFSNYDPVNNQLVMAGLGNNPMNLGMNTNYKYFAPRLGISYRLSDKTVIRTGFGISYTPFPDNTYAYNYPIKQNNQYQAPNSYATAVLPNGQAATFQAGIPAPTPVVIPQNGIIANPDPTQSYIVIPQNFKNPSVQSLELLHPALAAHALHAGRSLCGQPRRGHGGHLQPQRAHHSGGHGQGQRRPAAISHPLGRHHAVLCRLLVDVPRAADEVQPAHDGLAVGDHGLHLRQRHGLPDRATTAACGSTSTRAAVTRARTSTAPTPSTRATSTRFLSAKASAG